MSNDNNSLSVQVYMWHSYIILSFKAELETVFGTVHQRIINYRNFDFGFHFRWLGVLLMVCATRVHGIEQPRLSEPLTVAVASNFYYPLTQLLESTQVWQGQNLRLVSGSSGVLYAQIVNGAPYHVFLSADSMRPSTLYQHGMGQAPISYAIGELVLWPANIERSIAENLLESKGRVAIANPQTAPFGSAALAYLMKMPEYSLLKAKLVYGNNIAQTFQFIDTGNASIGFVAKSMLVQAMAKFPDNKAQYSEYLSLEDKSYPAIIQQAIVLSTANKPAHPLAENFIAFLLLASTQEQLMSLGYRKVSQ